MKRSKKAAIGAGTALAAVALAFVMLGVGNVPSYSSQATCGVGQPCTPASVTSGVGTFGAVDAGAIYSTVIQTSVLDAGAAYVPYICLNPTTCTNSISNTAGDMVLDPGSGVVRTPDDVNIGGTLRLGNGGSQDYLSCTGAMAGSGVTCTAVSTVANSPVTFVPKGTGTLAVTGAFSATSTVTGSQLLVSSLKAPVVHGSATVQQAMEPGTGSLNGSGTLAVTFTTAFGAAPVCVCSSAAATGNACGHDGTSTTAVTFRGTASEPIEYICIGHL